MYLEQYGRFPNNQAWERRKARCWLTVSNLQLGEGPDWPATCCGEKAIGAVEDGRQRAAYIQGDTIAETPEA